MSEEERLFDLLNIDGAVLKPFGNIDNRRRHDRVYFPFFAQSNLNLRGEISRIQGITSDEEQDLSKYILPT